VKLGMPPDAGQLLRFVRMGTGQRSLFLCVLLCCNLRTVSCGALPAACGGFPDCVRVPGQASRKAFPAAYRSLKVLAERATEVVGSLLEEVVLGFFITLSLALARQQFRILIDS
jgi:hypothetical protein